MFNVSDMFGSMVFDNKAMKNKLPHDVYKALMETVEDSQPLSIDIANHVANAMKEWAVEKGATHFNHWFQPMTGITAGKHDSFISSCGNNEIVMDFSGKELIKGEPDASSFPSGGLRATFEARGYTSWDPTSPAFIRDSTLYIPTAFCSYSGEVLDKKTPLLRSMDALNRQTMRILGLLGFSDVKRVTVTIGGEQEYFLIDKKLFQQRKDLIFCGRTLFGAKPPKGQELEDHYFGSIRPRVADFMQELDQELWKLGVLSKTKHNEVAPSQHELAPIFTTANIAVDHNQITMDLMKKIADKHGLACLLHEKPFAGINGSGKHNNWSVSTDTGVNLFDPGTEPENNLIFLTMLVALIKAVDEYSDLLRISVSSAGNDHRLGGHEAPPAIISMFLGSELSAVLYSIENNLPYIKVESSFVESGTNPVPNFKKDTTDRNRTSPIAFTGNKFEFRMPGSSFSLAGPNIVINTAMADVLSDFADTLEPMHASSPANFDSDLMKLLSATLKKHSRVVFDGNNYTCEWAEEARKRGLLNLKCSADALPYFKKEKNVSLFARHSIFTREEVASRCELMLQNYSKIINIEALTMLDMVKKDLVPALLDYTSILSTSAINNSKLSDLIDISMEEELLIKLSKLGRCMFSKSRELDDLLLLSKDYLCSQELAVFFSSCVVNKMNEIRMVSDEIESFIPRSKMPYPTYSELLFSV
ncbi:MAG: glutamine synthetase III [Proteocatella sp.]